MRIVSKIDKVRHSEVKEKRLTYRIYTLNWKEKEVESGFGCEESLGSKERARLLRKLDVQFQCSKV